MLRFIALLYFRDPIRRIGSILVADSQSLEEGRHGPWQARASRAPELQKRSFLFARHFFLTEIGEVLSVISCDFYVIEKSSAVNAK